MAHLSIEAKEAIVKKALSRGSQSLEKIAKENNISTGTLYAWLRLKRGGVPIAGKPGRPVSKPKIPPLKHLLATEHLDEQALGAYCREHGIYSFQLKQWQDELMARNDSPKQTEQERSEIKKLRNENKQLKQDLRRKDKALAETSALLILKKKADLIWGDLEED
jgi:transposase